MWSCDQSLVTPVFLWEKLSKPQFYKGLTRKTNFFEKCSWFKFINFELALDMTLKFYTSVAKGLKLKVRNILVLIPTFRNYRRKTGCVCVYGGGGEGERGEFVPFKELLKMDDDSSYEKPVVHYKLSQTSNMELFAKIGNEF